jgi:hypothetical protein
MLKTINKSIQKTKKTWAPSSIPMTPEAVLPRSAGIVKGDTYIGNCY